MGNMTTYSSSLTKIGLEQWVATALVMHNFATNAATSTNSRYILIDITI
jgi:hypothetical protein